MALHLQHVQYTLPNTTPTFTSNLINYLSPVGTVTNGDITLYLSDDTFVPTTSITFADIAIPQVSFLLSDKTTIDIDITNTTQMSKQSPHQYQPISLDTFITRMAPFPLIRIDHTGFNLPYFDGIHPEILELRDTLRKTCLYHTFPKHLEDAPWDFVLPGSEKEISGEKPIDYTLNRTPKIEIVSFDKSSTPLIQFDIQLTGSYEDWVGIFPEALHILELRSPWVYVTNDTGIDICFVLNEVRDKDWSYHFANERLV